MQDIDYDALEREIKSRSRAVKPVDTDSTTQINAPPPTPTPPVGRTMDGIMEQLGPAINPMTYIRALGDIPGTIGGMIKSQADTGGRALDEFGQAAGSDISLQDRVGHLLQGLRHGINTALPGIGPVIDKAQNEFQDPNADKAHAVGSMIGSVGLAGLGSLGERGGELLQVPAGKVAQGIAELPLRGRVAADDISDVAKTALDNNVRGPGTATKRAASASQTTDALAKQYGGGAPLVSPVGVTTSAWDRVAKDTGFPDVPMPPAIRRGMRKTAQQFVDENPHPLSLQEGIDAARAYQNRPAGTQFDPAMQEGLKIQLGKNSNGELGSAIDNEFDLAALRDALTKNRPPSDFRIIEAAQAMMHPQQAAALAPAVISRFPRTMLTGAQGIKQAAKALPVAGMLPAFGKSMDDAEKSMWQRLVEQLQGGGQ